MNLPVLPRYKAVLTYGRFDLFDQDHVHFLRHLSGLGDELIVGCATDDHARSLGTPCQMSYEARRAMLVHCRFVDRVIAETAPAQKRTDIVNYNVSTLAMGTEWQGQLEHLRDVAQVLYLPRRAASAAAISWMPDGQFAVGF